MALCYPCTEGASIDARVYTCTELVGLRNSQTTAVTGLEVKKVWDEVLLSETMDAPQPGVPGGVKC